MMFATGRCERHNSSRSPRCSSRSVRCLHVLHVLLVGAFAACAPSSSSSSVDAFNSSNGININNSRNVVLPSTSNVDPSSPLSSSCTMTKRKANANDLDGHDDDDGDIIASSSHSTSSSLLYPIRAGFVGCGTIASAIATSLATPSHAPHLAAASTAGGCYSLSSIAVTRRSESRSAMLKERFARVITVYDTAEEVVENSDVVFLCVLPQQVDGVLEGLREKGVWRTEAVEGGGRMRHTLISLVSTSNVDDLVRKSGLPESEVYKMICLPAIANREGCALLQPAAASSKKKSKTTTSNGEDEAGSSNCNSFDPKALLDALGGCVVCADDEAMNALMVTTAMMGPTYGVLRNNRDWLVKRGISPEDASHFVGRSYLSMVQDAERGCRDPGRFDELVEEQTPGGLNEQALGNLDRQGVFGSYDRAMDAVLSRLQGKSDGSLPSDP